MAMRMSTLPPFKSANDNPLIRSYNNSNQLMMPHNLGLNGNNFNLGGHGGAAGFGGGAGGSGGAAGIHN